MDSNRLSSQDLPGIGIFGTGTPTRKLVPLLKKEGFRIEAIWGRTREEAEKAAESLDIPYATNKIDDVLLRKDVDLIVVLSPPSHHSQIAVKALGIGKHVAVQCPGGLNQDETVRMVQAAQYYPRLISTLICGLRYLPAYQKMRQEIKDGNPIGSKVKLIDVRLNMASLVGKGSRYTWLCDSTMGGGLLNLFASQIIDLVTFLTGGQKAVRVHGILRTLTPTTPDIGGIRHINSDDCITFQIETDGGVVVFATINGQLSGFEQEVFVSGEGQGHLVVRNGDLYKRANGDSKEERVHKEEKDKETENVDGCSTPLYSGIYLKGVVNMFHALAKQFVAQNVSHSDQEDVASSSDLPSFDNALYVHAVIEAIRRSAKDRAWTKVTFQEW